MKKNYRVKLLATGLALACLFIIPRPAFSADVFDLSYSLTEGGYRLELDPANPYKGVKITVISNVSTRYEIIQNTVRTLENRDNPGEIIRENFVMRRITEGTPSGAFHVQSNDIPVSSIERIYTSDPSGREITFTLVYGIKDSENIRAGHYYGQISFTLRPIDSSRSQVTKYLDVYVTISREEARPSIEITTPTGARTITLNSKREGAQAFDAIVKINGQFKNLFSIKQVLTKPFESNEGNQLDYEAVNFVVQEARKGVPINQLTPLSSRQQIVYTSGAKGEADESFVITYSLADLAKQKAGRYNSRIQYLLEEVGKPSTLLDTLELEVENERIFEIVFTPQDQKGAIEFNNLKPKEPPKINEVIIEIKTNVGKKYQVIQKVYSDLTNKEGNIIPSEQFTLRAESLDTKGKLKFPKNEEIKKGDTVLFVSDEKGSSDKFKVIYELTIPDVIKGGDYSTKIAYSLLEI